MILCPQCGSEYIRKSRRMGVVEKRLLAVLLVKPFRCEECNFRFFRFSFTANPNPARSATT